MAMIEVRSLKKAFGKNAVLNGLSCTIEKGQTTAIIDRPVPEKAPCFAV